MTSRPHALPFVDDTCLVMEAGMTGATANYYTGLYELDEMGFALHLLRPGDLFCDIGATVGSYTVLAHAAGAVPVAFEPIPLTYARLERNVAANGIQAELHRCGLSSRAGELHFTTDLDATNHVAAEGLAVPVRTLDEVMAGRIPYMLKIDVEGHELEVLRGAAASLAHTQVALIETRQNEREIGAVMSGHGFRPFVYDALARRLSPASEGHLNTMFVRDPEAVQNRCASARRYRLVNGTI